MARTLKLVLFVAILSNNLAFGQTREKVPESEIKDIIKLAIDLPQLQEYYHLDKDSLRIPLIIMEFGTVNSKNLNGLEKFGEPVEVITEETIKKENLKAYLHIGDWTFGGDYLRLQMSYPIEGILVNIRLNRIKGQWAVVNSMIVEE